MFGFKKKKDETQEWFDRAMQGDSDAQYTLGTMYESGRTLPQDYELAMEWYMRAATGIAQDEDAQYRIGRMYENGLGVPRDISKAIEWYKKACEYRNYPSEEAEAALKRLGEW